MNTTKTGIYTPEDLRSRCWVDPDSGCWHWRGAVRRDGTPSTWLPGVGRTMSLGGVACFFANGRAPLPSEAWHCTCKTVHCANPEHRTCGNRSSQMSALGLFRSPLQRAKISRAKRAKSHLTEEHRAEIANSDELLRVLAERYGISVSLAQKIRSGRTPAIAGRASSVFCWRPAA